MAGKCVSCDKISIQIEMTLQKNRRISGITVLVTHTRTW